MQCEKLLLLTLGRTLLGIIAFHMNGGMQEAYYNNNLSRMSVNVARFRRKGRQIARRRSNYATYVPVLLGFSGRMALEAKENNHRAKQQKKPPS